jgi:MtN3 and saliva related transmembrane protein
MLFAEIIGYIAGILIAITMIPQIKVSLKTKSVKGLSTSMVVIFFMSVFLWTVYGILIKSYPLIITDGFATIISGIQVCIKFKYN